MRHPRRSCLQSDRETPWRAMSISPDTLDSIFTVGSLKNATGGSELEQEEASARCSDPPITHRCKPTSADNKTDATNIFPLFFISPRASKTWPPLRRRAWPWRLPWCSFRPRLEQRPLSTSAGERHLALCSSRRFCAVIGEDYNAGFRPREGGQTKRVSFLN